MNNHILIRRMRRWLERDSPNRGKSWVVCLALRGRGVKNWGMKAILVMSCAMLIAACQNTGPSFANMSEVELAAYNEDRPMEVKVYCVREADTSTYIRKRTCRTVADWVRHNERSAMALDVLNMPTSYNLPGTMIQDGPQRQ